MRFVEEFRNGDYAQGILSAMNTYSGPKIRLMEFCGGHTVTLLKYGIPDLLPDTIEMVSGPGCPVCVTSQTEVDNAIALSKHPDVILTSFGDMVRVKGSNLNLSEQKSLEGDIRIVYSPEDSLSLAKKNPDKRVVFFAVGFETTAPVTASAIKRAQIEGIDNFFVYSAHKTSPGILKTLLDEEIALDGFICPGHVTAITGVSIYDVLLSAGKPCIVSGFEPLDILQSISFAVHQIMERKTEVHIQYSRVVKPKGNVTAQNVMNEVFVPSDAYWRGIGVVPGTGLHPGNEYSKYDARKEFSIPCNTQKEEMRTKECLCGSILRGVKTPQDCVLFRNRCTPQTPVGACMVSDEGSCATYFKYSRTTSN